MDAPGLNESLVACADAADDGRPPTDGRSDDADDGSERDDGRSRDDGRRHGNGSRLPLDDPAGLNSTGPHDDAGAVRQRPHRHAGSPH